MAASSASAGDSPPPSSPDAAQNNLQHFFILHKASEKSTSSWKPRKRLDLCPTKLKEGDEGCLRMEAFQLVWSGIESSIKDVLRNMNAHVFNQIHSWVCDSFGAIKPIAPFSSPLGPFPIVTRATCCAQLFTALLLTKNMESERMDAVVEAALVRQCSGFAVGHKVAMFLRNYFLNQDGTLTSFLRALKIACVQHFSSEPLRLILGRLLVKEDTKGSQNEKVIKCASKVLCHGRDQMAEQTDINVAHGLTELKRLQMLWSTVVLCLYEAGKCDKVQLLDLFCEALDPDVYNSFASDNDNRTGLGKNFVTSLSNDHCMLEQHLSSRKGRLICQVVRKVRDLPAALLCQLLKSWEVLTVNVLESPHLTSLLQEFGHNS